MHLCSLSLVNFRIYKEASFDFAEGINAIIGDNAVGKTSVLEAIYLSLFGRSFRTQEIKDLIREGADAFHIELIFVKNGIEQRLSISQSRTEKRILHNSTYFSSFASLLGILQGVLLAPHDIDLIQGPPSARRLFLDMQLAQVDPLYVHYLQRYNRALRQRNTLLKTKNLAAIEPFEHQLAKSAAYLHGQRVQNVAALSVLSDAMYRTFSLEREVLKIRYKTSAPLEGVENYYLKQYGAQRKKELELGFTLSGPHKDEMEIQINGKEARYFASEGQQRSCVAALHLGEWQRLKEVSSAAPLFMIDDVGISLDEKRKERLLQLLGSLGQVFLTTTDHRLADSFSGPKKIISLPLDLAKRL